MIKILKTKEELILMQDSWNELYTQSSSVSPFQTFDYVLAAWNFLNEKDSKLHVICVYRQKDKLLQALFPFCLKKKNYLVFINDNHSDFCSEIVRKEFADDYHVYEEVADYIKSNEEIRGMRFDNQRPDSRLSAYFCYFFVSPVVVRRTAFSTVSISKNDNQTKNVVDTLPNLNTKDRYRLKNIQKKAVGEDFVVYSKNEGKEYPETTIKQLIDDMIDNKIRTEDYFDGRMLTLFSDLYHAGLLQVHVTLKEETPLAANLYLKSSDCNEYIDWIALYKEKKYNLDNLLATISHIAEIGGVLNFARGTYPYKIHNFRPCISNLYRFQYSKTMVGSIGVLIDAAWINAKQIIKRIVRK